MKRLLLILLLSIFAYGQEKKAVFIYGTVTSANKELKLENSVGIEINYSTANNSYLTFEGVDKNGAFIRKLEDIQKITVGTYYHDFYAKQVTVNTPYHDSIKINLELIPKPYTFTADRAVKDIVNKKVQIITYDSIDYTWSQKIDMKKEFGFNYILIKEPDDRDFSDNIENYNSAIENYLYNQNHDWKARLHVVRDSMINLKADNYGKKTKIDVENLKVPEMKELPKTMQEKLIMWQTYYDNYYKDELKDFTIPYVLNVITSNKQYSNFRILQERISIDYQKMIPQLIKLLVDKNEIGMEGYTGIMIGRDTGAKEFLPCVAIPYSKDDLYTVAGRANHLLELLTGENFGTVSPNPTSAWLKKLQNRWAYWLIQLQK